MQSQHQKSSNETMSCYSTANGPQPSSTDLEGSLPHHHHLDLALTTVPMPLAHAPKLYFDGIWGQRKKPETTVPGKVVFAQKEIIIQFTWKLVFFPPY